MRYRHRRNHFSRRSDRRRFIRGCGCGCNKRRTAIQHRRGGPCTGYEGEGALGGMIVIIDYNMGNLGSILNMLKKVGVSAMVSAGADDIMAATKLILPGVGAFDNGMQ